MHDLDPFEVKQAFQKHPDRNNEAWVFKEEVCAIGNPSFEASADEQRQQLPAFVLHEENIWRRDFLLAIGPQLHATILEKLKQRLDID